jgi:hypothetical protein
MSAKYFIKEKKNQLNVFGTSRTNTGKGGTVKDELHHLFMINQMNILFRSDNNRREKRLNPRLERILT